MPYVPQDEAVGDEEYPGILLPEGAAQATRRSRVRYNAQDGHARARGIGALIGAKLREREIHYGGKLSKNARTWIASAEKDAEARVRRHGRGGTPPLGAGTEFPTHPSDADSPNDADLNNLNSDEADDWFARKLRRRRGLYRYSESQESDQEIEAATPGEELIKTKSHGSKKNKNSGEYPRTSDDDDDEGEDVSKSLREVTSLAETRDAAPGAAG